ncbi:uncharacterized protein N7459_003067 [Penicillium hispanicum]|uniref:uncharacterized protein n=1 Tax=Penicillium hispanicum TaxID=1080232 RepID=UPI00254254CB|nr:uncharacterized protein N7459_003067 [Penicillium hispanicum]KAJ5587302.1 hypothetical protein N7459_003067 [Penicillium hispanicum]
MSTAIHPGDSCSQTDGLQTGSWSLKFMNPNSHDQVSITEDFTSPADFEQLTGTSWQRHSATEVSNGTFFSSQSADGRLLDTLQVRWEKCRRRRHEIPECIMLTVLMLEPRTQMPIIEALLLEQLAGVPCDQISTADLHDMCTFVSDHDDEEPRSPCSPEGTDC